MPSTPPRRRTRRRAGVVVATLAAVLAAPWAAQAQDLDVDRFRPTGDPRGFLTMPSTLPAGDRQWDVGLWLDYEYRSLVVDVAGDDAAILQHRLRGVLTGRFGLGDRVSLAVALPATFVQASERDVVGAGGSDLTVAALGDARVGLLVRAVGEPARRSPQEPAGLGLAFQGDVVLPTGSPEGLLGEPDARLALRAILDWHLFGLGAGVGLGWRHRFVHRSFPGVDARFRDELEATVGLRIPLPPPRAPALVLEGRLAVDARDPFADGALTAAEVDLAARFRAVGGALALTVGVGAGLTDAVGVPRVRGFVAAHWGTRVPDADEDGVPDAVDQCKQLPEDLDGFEDEDGCLDPDDDLDGIEDAADRCPRDPVGFDDDADGDGCPDAAPPENG